MSTWVILSWIFVLILTAINIVLFVKLKQASEQMMKMAFPGAKNMNEAVSQMQNMMQGMQGLQGLQGAMKGMKGAQPGLNRGFRPPAGKAPAKQQGNMDAQLKAAMEMLKQVQKNGGKR